MELGRIDTALCDCDSHSSKTEPTNHPAPQPEQTHLQPFPLLHLPPELVHHITEFLSLADRFHLSQTCAVLREIARPKWRTPPKSLSEDEQVEFIAGIAHTRADLIFCRGCRIHHHYVKHNRCFTKLKAFRYFGLCLLWEEEVQLALKLTRLGKAGKALPYFWNLSEKTPYLETILRPRPVKKYEDLGIMFDPLFWRKHTRDIWATPKVTPGPAPRFLLQVEWWYYYDHQDPVDNHLGCTDIPISVWEEDQPICEHLICFGNKEDVSVLPGRAYEPSRYCLPDSADPELRTCLAVARRPEMHGCEVVGGCRRCATDYSFTVCPGRLRLRAWYDYGTETEPIDHVRHSARGAYVGDWRLQERVSRLEFRRGNNKDDKPRVPGSIRQLFNST